MSGMSPVSPPIAGYGRRAAALLVLAGLCACGRKGALYLPGEEEDARRLPRQRPSTPTEDPDGFSDGVEDGDSDDEGG